MRPSRAHKPSSPIRRAALVALAVGIVAAAPLWMADVTLSGERVFPIPIAPAALLLIGRLLDRIAPGDAGPRGKAVNALALASLGPSFFYAAWAALDQPLFHEHRLPEGPNALLLVLAGLILVPLAVAPIAAWVAYRARAVLDAAIEGTAALAVIGAAVLVGAGAMRSLEAPPPEGWWDSMQMREQDDAGARTTVDLRFDPRSHFYAARSGDQAPVLYSPCNAEISEVSPAQIAPHLAPPRAWLGLAALGVLLSVGALGSNARRLGDLRRFAHARVGTLAEGGWIHFEDGSPPMRSPAAGLPEGPVVVFGASLGARAPYRSDGLASPVTVQAGTREACLAAARGPIAGAAATALAITVLTAGPLLAAALRGMAF
jgi:hypothetical protein